MKKLTRSIALGSTILVMVVKAHAGFVAESLLTGGGDTFLTNNTTYIWNGTTNVVWTNNSPNGVAAGSFTSNSVGGIQPDALKPVALWANRDGSGPIANIQVSLSPQTATNASGVLTNNVNSSNKVTFTFVTIADFNPAINSPAANQGYHYNQGGTMAAIAPTLPQVFTFSMICNPNGPTVFSTNPPQTFLQASGGILTSNIVVSSVANSGNVTINALNITGWAP